MKAREGLHGRGDPQIARITPMITRLKGTSDHRFLKMLSGLNHLIHG